MNADRIYIVIPAKDEASRIESVLMDLHRLDFHDIIVVDDGSEDGTAEVAGQMGCTVLRHPVNLGAGAATLTGIEYALDQKADLILTMDADGQHAATDVPRLLASIRESDVEVVIGVRFSASTGRAPMSRKVFNRIANVLTWVLTGQYSHDSQSGMKCIRGSFAQKLDFRFSRFEFCTELFHFISKERARFVEIPIQTIYTRDTLSKGQSIWVGIRMAYRLLRSKI